MRVCVWGRGELAPELTANRKLTTHMLISAGLSNTYVYVFCITCLKRPHVHPATRQLRAERSMCATALRPADIQKKQRCLFLPPPPPPPC